MASRTAGHGEHFSADEFDFVISSAFDGEVVLLSSLTQVTE